MDTEETTPPSESGNKSSAELPLEERLAELEERVERLEREMAAIARMEGAIEKMFGGSSSD